MSSKIIRYLILFLVLALALVVVMVYVGSDRVIGFEFLDQAPRTGKYISLQIAIAAIAAFALAIIILWSLFVWLLRLPAKMKTGLDKKRNKAGFDALAAALLAIENGRGKTAAQKAKKAHEILNMPQLTGLVLAKSAELTGDTNLAQEQYNILAENEKTRNVGLKGLARLSAAKGDHSSVIEKAKAVFKSDKSSKWAFNDLFGAQIAMGKWAEALESVKQAESHKNMDRQQARRIKSVLLSAQADRLDKQGDVGKASELAVQAAELEPGFAPAIALAARLLGRSGDNKKAARLIERAWGKSPHPALAQAYKDLLFADDSKTRAKKLSALARQNKNHRESHILMAEQALENGDGEGALTALDPLLHADNVSARLCLLAGHAEELCGNAVDARAWQIRAASAPIEADWSDLDPDGPAFVYSDDDWAKLVETYGKTGELIHPRLQAGLRRKSVVQHNLPDNKTGIGDETINEDEAEALENEIDEKSESLASRLERLLDRKHK